MATVTQTKTKTTTKTTTTIKPKQKYTFQKPDSRTHKYLRVSEDLTPLVKDSSDSDEEPFFHRGTYVAARYGRAKMNKNKSNVDSSYVIDDMSDGEDLDLIMPIQKGRRYQLGSCCACTCSIL